MNIISPPQHHRVSGNKNTSLITHRLRLPPSSRIKWAYLILIPSNIVQAARGNRWCWRSIYRWSHWKWKCLGILRDISVCNDGRDWKGGSAANWEGCKYENAACGEEGVRIRSMEMMIRAEELRYESICFLTCRLPSFQFIEIKVEDQVPAGTECHVEID